MKEYLVLDMIKLKYCLLNIKQQSLTKGDNSRSIIRKSKGDNPGIL